MMTMPRAFLTLAPWFLGLLSTAAPVALAHFAWRGATAATTPAMQECLERMGLDKPQKFADRISAFILRGALTQTLGYAGAAV